MALRLELMARRPVVGDCLKQRGVVNALCESHAFLRFPYQAPRGLVYQLLISVNIAS